jgi:hypothetical protein
MKEDIDESSEIEGGSSPVAVLALIISFGRGKKRIPAVKVVVRRLMRRRSSLLGKPALGRTGKTVRA